MWLLSGPIYILIHVGYEGVCVCSLRLLCVTEKQISVGLFCESVAYFVPLFPLFSQIASIHFSHDSSAGSSECKHFLLNQTNTSRKFISSSSSHRPVILTYSKMKLENMA